MQLDSSVNEKKADQFKFLGNCPPTPPLITLTLTCYVGQNVSLGDGLVSSFPEKLLKLNQESNTAGGTKKYPARPAVQLTCDRNRK